MPPIWLTANFPRRPAGVLAALPCACDPAHGKGQVCRVSEFQHTANILAHGNLGVFGSDRYLAVDENVAYHSMHNAVKSQNILLPWGVEPRTSGASEDLVITRLVLRELLFSHVDLLHSLIVSLLMSTCKFLYILYS